MSRAQVKEPGNAGGLGHLERHHADRHRRTTSDTLSLTGVTSGAAFLTASDGATVTDVTVTCFFRGTRILTPCAEKAVEDLRIDDKVKTFSRPKSSGG